MEYPDHNGPPAAVNVNVGPWALVAHRCLCRTRTGERCKRKTRHLSRVCYQHRDLYMPEEILEMVNRRRPRCQAITLKGLQCSRDGTRNYVLQYCTQHYGIHAEPEVQSD
ncbi:uncharacterized protein LOC105442405 [Strongylocentrotus purpuratus]|uniref:Uncharacterized protein n=1 Tax=Strongylocentrotus purpuratus TaxID=7668 RepID=A0A7M7T2N4_STRPU|nr:uncharacterized protein LOC105442405 [Strongylocentrotus purpuratus]